VSGEVILLREQDFETVTGDDIFEAWEGLGKTASGGGSSSSSRRRRRGTRGSDSSKRWTLTGRRSDDG